MTRLTHEPLSVEVLIREVASPERGGTCVFLGSVRNGPEESGVIEIEYSAYDAMADAEIERIVTEAQRQWPGVRVALRHRVGRVPVGEASIAIVAAAPHRAEAFAACRHVIEEVKRRLPIWKKEYRIDGTAAWVDPSGKPVAHGP